MADLSINPESLQQVTQPQSKKKPDKNLEGFDFLRRIFSVIVVPRVN